VRILTEMNVNKNKKKDRDEIVRCGKELHKNIRNLREVRELVWL